MKELASEQMVVLFAILVVGYGLGRVQLRGISLGTAGVLFSALFFGHIGFRIPKEIMDFGLLLFVYAVGLQAGPRFFRNFKHAGARFIVLASVSILVGTLASLLVAWYMGLTPDLAVGLFCGALTNTPALAAAIDAVNRIGVGQSSMVSVGYGIAYPFSMIGLVLLMQFLPRILRKDVTQEEAAWEEESLKEHPNLLWKQFLITNPNCDGKTVREINPNRMSNMNLSRIKRGDEVFTVSPDTVLRSGDVVRAVGLPEDLDILKVVLGEESQTSMDLNQDILSVDIDVTEASIGAKTVRELHVVENYGVLISRLRREGIEFVPKGSTRIQIGDQIHVVGKRDDVNAFIKLVGGSEHRLEETTMTPFLVGLLLGIAFGNISIPLWSGVNVRLGSAGGAFLMSLILGHYGTIGRFKMYVPAAAKNLSRELGLMLFLAGAGTTAGAKFLDVLIQQGFGLFIAGAFVTIVTVGTALFLAHVLFRMNILATMGSLGACMTNPPSLGAAQAQTESELPTLAYASAYPVALISKIVIAQLIVQMLGH